MRTHDDFSETRKGRLTNRWLQIVLAIALAFGLNALSGIPSLRLRQDLTKDLRHS